MDLRDKFIKEYQKVPVIEYQNYTCIKPLVSVCVVTYQQKHYIENCLDGILMQKTKFDFEILLGEDHSTDGTREICIKYAKKHPDKIKLFLHSNENKIIKYGKSTGSFNLKYNIFSAKGKYIALCDGDDYWIDPLKLQKQVDFLETNEEFGLVFSDVKMNDAKGNDIRTTQHYDKIKLLYKSGYVFWNLLESNYINTLTTLTRKELIINYYYNFDEEFSYDHRLWLHVSCYSKIKFFDKKMAVYRVHDMGISRSNGFFNKRTPLVKQSALIHFMSLIPDNGNIIDKRIISKVIYSIITNKYLDKGEKEPTINLLKKYPKFIIYIIGMIIDRLFNKLGII